MFDCQAIRTEKQIMKTAILIVACAFGEYEELPYQNLLSLLREKGEGTLTIIRILVGIFCS